MKLSSFTTMKYSSQTGITLQKYVVAQIKELDETFLIKQFLKFLLFYIANKKNQQKIQICCTLFLIYPIFLDFLVYDKNEQEFQRDFCLSFITLGFHNLEILPISKYLFFLFIAWIKVP